MVGSMTQSLQISGLPSEIILCIFEAHIISAYDIDLNNICPATWYAFSQVCRKWRNIALQFGQLWSIISAELIHAERLIPLVFRRSRSAILTVIARGWSHTSVLSLKHSFSRVQRLSIDLATLGHLVKIFDSTTNSILGYAHVEGACLEQSALNWPLALLAFRTVTTLRLSGLHAIKPFLHTVSTLR